MLSRARILASETRFQTQKRAEEMCFYKPCTLAASESEFDHHVNRILCLKVGMLVYPVARLSKCQG